MRRWVLAGGLLVLVAAFAVLVGWPLLNLAYGDAHVLVERVAGETPQRRVAAYFAAIRRGDRDGALAAWPVSNQDSDDLQARREAITDELLRVGPSVQYAIVRIEWWRNCCEPGPATNPAAAGVARITLSVSGVDSAEVHYYTADVTTPGSYWGAAGGDPVRHWLLRDVYRIDEQPLAFPWPAPDAPTATAQSLAETERDQTLWLSYTSPTCGVSLRYPPGWSVIEIVYEKQGDGPVIRVASGDRVLELVHEGRLPPGLGSSSGTASIGSVPAEIYEVGDAPGPHMAIVVPADGGDAVAYARIELPDAADDDGYMAVFDAILSTVTLD